MRCPSEWDHLVLDHLAFFEPVERHSAQAVQLADEGHQDRMIDEVSEEDDVLRLPAFVSSE